MGIQDQAGFWRQFRIQIISSRFHWNVLRFSRFLRMLPGSTSHPRHFLYFFFCSSLVFSFSRSTRLLKCSVFHVILRLGYRAFVLLVFFLVFLFKMFTIKTEKFEKEEEEM